MIEDKAVCHVVCRILRGSYWTVFVVCNGTLTPSVQCTVLAVLNHFTLRVRCHFWTPICNVLGYWRHLFISDSTSRHYNLCLQCVMTLWCRVSERFFDLFSVFCSVISLQCFSSLSLSLSLLSSILLPATSQHGHSWHRAPLGPMAIYLFNVKTFVFLSSFVPPPLIKRERLDFFYNWCSLTTPFSTRGHKTQTDTKFYSVCVWNRQHLSRLYFPLQQFGCLGNS
jgi:hypothetical protein